MSLAELIARWQRRRVEFAEFGVSLDGTKLADAVLADLAALDRDLHASAVTLKEASALGGYSVDHLQRLVAAGQLENVGRKGRPRIRQSDVPVRPGHRLPEASEADQLSARRRIVASVATRNQEAR
jgi:hypothetical protein